MHAKEYADMKRSIPLILLALLVGGGLGYVSADAGARPSTAPPAALTDAASAPSPSRSAAPEATCPAQDGLFSQMSAADNRALLNQAEVVLALIQTRDFQELAKEVHPQRGVTFTPYSTVDPEYDVTLTAAQLARAAADDETRCWGYADGSGLPISLTTAQYFDQYVYAADYSQAPIISVDYILAYGNAAENVTEAYPDGRFAEFHFPGLDPTLQGVDWCSLKLVFADHMGEWKLVGCINSQWTI